MCQTTEDQDQNEENEVIRPCPDKKKGATYDDPPDIGARVRKEVFLNDDHGDDVPAGQQISQQTTDVALSYRVVTLVAFFATGGLIYRFSTSKKTHLDSKLK